MYYVIIRNNRAERNGKKDKKLGLSLSLNFDITKFWLQSSYNPIHTILLVLFEKSIKKS